MAELNAALDRQKTERMRVEVAAVDCNGFGGVAAAGDDKD